jgi:hypothetical protein
MVPFIYTNSWAVTKRMAIVATSDLIIPFLFKMEFFISFNLIRISVLNFRFNFTISLNRKLHKNNNVLRIFFCEFRTILDTWTLLWVRFTFKQKERHDLVNNTYYISIHTSSVHGAFVKDKTLRRDHKYFLSDGSTTFFKSTP